MPRRYGAARFRTPAVVEVRAQSPDQYGNQQTRWQPFLHRHIELDETPGSESLEGGVLQSHTRAIARLRLDRMTRQIPNDARIRARGRIFSVLSRAEGDELLTSERGVMTLHLDAGVMDGGVNPITSI